MNFAQHDRRPLIERQLFERLPDTACGFLLLQQTIRKRETARLRQLAMLRQMFLERDLLATAAPTPPAAPVRRLIDHDSIDPRSQRGLTAELVQRPKDVEEDFL